MNDRILYNAQKEVLEEVKQELLKRTESERQRNIIKEVCNSVARKHKFDDKQFFYRKHKALTKSQPERNLRYNATKRCQRSDHKHFKAKQLQIGLQHILQLPHNNKTLQLRNNS